MVNTLNDQQSLIVTYAKGLGMILVVLGHYFWQPGQVYSVYLFHMPLFFILGGLVSKPTKDYWRMWRKVWSQYVLYLLVWYCVIAFVTTLIKYYYPIKVSLYLGQSWDLLIYPWRFNMHNNSLFMVAWFLVAYALSSLLFKIFISRYPKVNRPALLLLGLGIGYCGIYLFAPLYHAVDGWGKSNWYLNILSQVCVGTMFIAFGYCLRSYLLQLASGMLCVLAVMVLLMLVGLDLLHPINMSWSRYPDGLFGHICAALLGTVAVLSLAGWYSRKEGQSTLLLIGQHSKDIMTLHLLGLVVADLICAQLGWIELSAIRELNHFRQPQAWLLYCVLALLAPIAVRYSLNYIKRRVGSLIMGIKHQRSPL